jgi:septum formation protein
MEKMSGPQAGDAKLQPELLLSEKLALASASPRRAEILRAVGWNFEPLPVNIPEERGSGEDAVSYVERLAREKAEAATARIETGLVLGADTVVLAGADVLEKPHDEADARRMLRRLSGRWHEVLTGVALLRAGENICRVAHERTKVRFRQLSEEETNWYVATGEPMDKAGAYAVQGRAALFIEAIRGDYWNVVGLPIQLVYKLAREIRQR